MDLLHEHLCFNFDHKSNLEKNKRRKLNRDMYSFFNSSKIRICNTLLNRLRKFRYANHNNIVRMNQDARQNKGYSIQRIEYLKCNSLFDQLKKLHPPSIKGDIGCPHKIFLIIIFNCGIGQMQIVIPRHL